jgi:hypothetical protein
MIQEARVRQRRLAFGISTASRVFSMNGGIYLLDSQHFHNPMFLATILSAPAPRSHTHPTPIIPPHSSAHPSTSMLLWCGSNNSRFWSISLYCLDVLAGARHSSRPPNPLPTPYSPNPITTTLSADPIAIPATFAPRQALVYHFFLPQHVGSTLWVRRKNSSQPSLYNQKENSN